MNNVIQIDGCVSGKDLTQRIRVEQELRSSEQRYRKLVDHLPFGLVIHDFRGRIVFVNSRVEQMLGLAGVELLGAGPDEFYRSFTDPRGVRLSAPDYPFWRVKRDGGSLDNALFGICREGREPGNWVVVNAYRECDDAGSLKEVVVTLFDVSDQTRTQRELADYRERLEERVARRTAELEREHARNAQIVASAMDGFFVADVEGRIRDCNERYCHMLGYSRDEFLQLRICDIEAVESADQIAAHVDRLLVAGHDRFDTRHRAKDGTLFEVEVKVSCGHVGGEPLLFGFVHDISDRKRLEQERLASLEKQRDVLVREVHHRIKNHLHGLIGLLQARRHSAVDERLLIEEAVAQVSSIAAVYGLNSQTLQRTTSISAIVRAIVGNWRDATRSADIHLAIDREIEGVQLDAEKAVPVALVINELVSNAIKHSDPPNELACITVKCHGRADRCAVTVGNVGNLPPAFDLEAGKGIKTGLELTQHLLPRNGAELGISQARERVEATITLSPPLVAFTQDERFIVQAVEDEESQAPVGR